MIKYRITNFIKKLNLHLIILIFYIEIINNKVIKDTFICLKICIKKSSEAGLEPATYGLGGRCATITPHGYCYLLK